MDASARQNAPNECDPRQVRKHKRIALCDRYVLAYAGNEAWGVGRTTADQAQGNFQKETDNWGNRVPLFHRSWRPVCTPATQEGRRWASGDFTLRDEAGFQTLFDNQSRQITPND